MRRSLACAILLLAITTAHATAPAAIWFGESLLCRQSATGARCVLWLDQDGHYTVFYDRNRPTTAQGAFRIEGRTGRYAASVSDGALHLCLRPEPDPARRGEGAGIALFHDAGCVGIPVHPIGEPFTLTYAGDAYTLVLAQGR